MNSTDLKPCKCGGVPGVDVAIAHIKMLGNPKYLRFRAYCFRCQLTTAIYRTKEQAANAWNEGEFK